MMIIIILITYMILASLVPWASGGRTCCPSSRAGPGDGGGGGATGAGGGGGEAEAFL